MYHCRLSFQEKYFPHKSHLNIFKRRQVASILYLIGLSVCRSVFKKILAIDEWLVCLQRNSAARLQKMLHRGVKKSAGKASKIQSKASKIQSNSEQDFKKIRARLQKIQQLKKKINSHF